MVSGMVISILKVYGLEVHSNGTKSVTFFGAQSSLGDTIFIWGARAVIWGGTRPQNAYRGGGQGYIVPVF